MDKFLNYYYISYYLLKYPIVMLPLQAITNTIVLSPGNNRSFFKVNNKHSPTTKRTNCVGWMGGSRNKIQIDENFLPSFPAHALPRSARQLYWLTLPFINRLNENQYNRILIFTALFLDEFSFGLAIKHGINEMAFPSAIPFNGVEWFGEVVSLLIKNQ